MRSDELTSVEKILASRGRLPHMKTPIQKCDEEGGCGVTGFIASIPVRGHHIWEPSVQMHNRGNGKGGGIAAVGLCAEDLGISQDVLDSHYLIQIAYLDPGSRPAVEKAYVLPVFDIHKSEKIPTLDDFKAIGLEVKPPDVFRYFVRVKQEALDAFIRENGFEGLDPRKAEDEFVFQNTMKLNQTFYASLGEKQAFVMSHGRNVMILKIVGYAEKVVQYYRLEDFRAHGWIAHQRYPTRGRLWHPGGAHPFSGMHEALVHNGDFANYHACCEYLHQNNIHPQFLTDTEVSILLLDLYSRVYGYPMEYIIEALAPTSEYDFDQLPKEKQKIYRAIQSHHMAGSPDGPWFFIIARNNPYKKSFQLIGITDTAMLRPQVFALMERKEVQIGLICSEKQALDATLESISKEDSRVCPVADKYWNARGGSATDGGSFTFAVMDAGKNDGTKKLVTINKFGEEVGVPRGQRHFDPSIDPGKPADGEEIKTKVRDNLSHARALIEYALDSFPCWDFDAVLCFLDTLIAGADKDDDARSVAVETLTFLNNRQFPTGDKKRSSLLFMIRRALTRIFKSCPKIKNPAGSVYAYIDRETREDLRPPGAGESVLVLNAREFEPEGPDCDARVLNKAFELGWRKFICFGYKGQRFTGCGFGPGTENVRIDVYDSSGDYLASGIDGMEIQVHGNAQDQVGQILKQGKLVIHGDVGQTFMYGAKGGRVFVRGNAAGRPLINGTGHPRVVINGTCLDYLAESFMAGDPLAGGGFVIVNGMEFDKDGNLIPMATPYPGANLFSLASGGAIYIRDPEKKLVDEQLNAGEFTDLSPEDWDLILPFLEENERLFGIRVQEDLLAVNGKSLDYTRVYRKVKPVKTAALSKMDPNEETIEERCA
ncbi:glutamate synthase subunit alpha [Desulfospira joergensenii]|uniref:GltB/FmdC/FwdC-like GXGXG domain-containing protein n=1 Tax=Desulfospira joergensenii TaxID=53329 RepID=UPI0003B4D886|nr:glutamate synthase subunit alpha [Desulfospira joergensenii]